MTNAEHQSPLIALSAISQRFNRLPSELWNLYSPDDEIVGPEAYGFDIMSLHLTHQREREEIATPDTDLEAFLRKKERDMGDAEEHWKSLMED